MILDTEPAERLEWHRYWPFSAGVAMAVYMLAPLPTLAVCGFAVMTWTFLRYAPPRTVRRTFVFCLVFLFAGAFLLNPLFAYLFAPENALNAFPARARIQGILAGLGCLWVWLTVRRARPLNLAPFVPPLWVSAAWMVVVLLLYGPSWAADLTLGGDEFYHVVSVRASQLLLREIFGSPLWGGLLLVWAVALCLPHLIDREDADGARIRVLLAILGIVLLAAAAFACYRDALLGQTFLKARTVRYPAAQAWISALLGMLRYDGWFGAYFSNRTFRLVPLFSVGWLGALLLGDPRARRLSPWLVLLAVVACLTVPDLRYHGTMLYLELAMMPLICVILFDCRQWLFEPYPRITRRPAWWAAIALGFMKDTGIVLLLVLWLARETVQTREFCRRQGEPRFRSWLAARLESGLIVIGPALLFLLLRRAYHVHPYPFSMGNLLAPDLWLRSARSLLQQFGALWLLCACGIALDLRRRRWSSLALRLLAAGSMWGMFFCEHRIYVGLARFNLLLFPSVLVWSWEAVLELGRRRPWLAGTAAAALLVVNLLMSPVNTAGERQPYWGYCGETWYPVRQCFTDLRQRVPEPKILLANMDTFAIGVLLGQLQWQAVTGRLERPPDTDTLTYLRGALVAAAERGYDVLIFRDAHELAPGVVPESDSGFVKVAEYPSRSGRLICFQRHVARGQSGKAAGTGDGHEGHPEAPPLGE